MKVLIVDDDRSRADGLRSYLVSADLLDIDRIDISESSDEAKISLQNFYYDVLIVDVVLPKRRGESARCDIGVGLVGQVHRSRGFKKPEKVIAITAHEDDVEQFRGKFEEYCTAVVRAYGPSDEWRRRILESIRYLSCSKIARVVSAGDTVVFSIHGIRTFGEWQSRLERLVEAETDEVSFYTYKYGYFSSIAFLFPPARRREVHRLELRIHNLLRNQPKRIVVFAHSFGTYLAVEAIKNNAHQLPAGVELTVVLGGSVLPENYDWSEIRKNGAITVINDCGVDDNILLLSKASAVNLGMAGRVGFHGFNGSGFINRWFRGGHSHYFDGDDFMRKRWLPVILGARVNVVDERGSPNVTAVALDGIARSVASVKWLLYASVAAILVFSLK